MWKLRKYEKIEFHGLTATAGMICKTSWVDPDKQFWEFVCKPWVVNSGHVSRSWLISGLPVESSYCRLRDIKSTYKLVPKCVRDRVRPRRSWWRCSVPAAQSSWPRRVVGGNMGQYWRSMMVSGWRLEKEMPTSHQIDPNRHTWLPAAFAFPNCCPTSDAFLPVCDAGSCTEGR